MLRLPDDIVELTRPPNFADFEHYVRFNQPIVVQPATTTTNWTAARIRHNLLRADAALVDSAPCDLLSNVRFGVAPRLRHIVEHTLASAEHRTTGDGGGGSPTSWYVSYRNCATGATKASRTLWPRAAWIPLHLRPYAASWLVMSTARASGPASVVLRPLRVRGLAVLAQLVGERAVRLSPNADDCEPTCAVLWHRLRPGETMVVDADRWRVDVVVSEEALATGGGAQLEANDGGLSVSFAAEFEWQY